MAELFSICIPTYNRAGMLGEIMESIGSQIRGTDMQDVVFYISDNASPDNTRQVVEEFGKRTGHKVIYSRNDSNIGISENILKVMAMGQGKYIWLLGDDELISGNSMVPLLKFMREQDPGFVLMFDTRYPWPLPKAGLYSDYRAFAVACMKLNNVHALAEHTLISSNIYKGEYFDPKFGRENIDTWFPHMFGFLRPLLKNKLSVWVPEFPVITTRVADRGTPRDGKWADLDQCWYVYLSWLRDEMQMPELDPADAGRTARKAMLANMRSHPIQYLKRYWRAFFQPSAYRFLWTRFFGAGK
jgi:glycosyltransferase involved in cell wall biosynthesis